ncbi:ABC transporter substrate-binding protein [Mycoplasma sp. P36-A1]|uniref:ABC transporter substrate-binding protein n=1 Tax=Mycoplasma sp. P36-A1 TaxID=3252900 RepID=UPI003C2D1720
MKKIFSLAFVCLMLVLTGCSTTSDQTTKTVSTVKGDVEIPSNPKRVIADYFVGDLLALGVTPIASTYIYEGAVFEDKLKDTPSINGSDAYGEYNLETIASLKPDLIITYSEADYDNLSKIAPTLLIDYLNITTQERITWTADVLNKQKEGEKLISDFNNEVATYKQKLIDSKVYDKTITLMETYVKELFVYGNKQGRGGDVLYDLLGLKATKIVQDEIINGEQYRSISLEVIDDYASDMIMIGSWQEDPMTLVGKNKVWLSTDAVKNNKVITYDSSAYIYQDIQSTTKQLKDITNSILALYE